MNKLQTFEQQKKPEIRLQLYSFEHQIRHRFVAFLFLSDGFIVTVEISLYVFKSRG